MIKWEELEGGKYLSAKNLPGRRLTLTITSVLVEDVGTPPVPKAIVYGAEDERGLVLNATRRTILREALGDDDAKWIGRRILITVGRAMFQGKGVDALVVQVLPVATKSAKTTKLAPAPVEDEIPTPGDPDWEVADEA